jgi:hypothetical protein
MRAAFAVAFVTLGCRAPAQDDADKDAIVAALEAESLPVAPLTDPLPTLRDLIDAGTTIVWTNEASGRPPAWYHATYDWFQETPYSWSSAAAMDCGEHRGSVSNPLFLLNHWIGPLPSRAHADTANAYDVLSERALRCRDERGMQPNLVAVDFWDRGALVDVVAELNAP